MPDRNQTEEKEAVTKLSTDQARQGQRGKPVLIVLIAGLILAAILALVLHPFKQDAGTLDGTAVVEESAATNDS